MCGPSPSAGSTTWIVCASHILTTDASLTLFLTLTLCAVLLAECAEPTASARRRWIWLAWSSMACAVLSKGLVGIVIPGCTLLAASLWLRDFALLRRMRLVSGSLIFLVIAAPWFLLVSLRNPGFAEFFFIHEHFARYLTTVHHHVGAWWYYLPLLLAGLLPWTSGLPWIVRRQRPVAAAGDREVVSLLVAWSLFVLVFFSLSGSKLPFYIVPMFPALALLLTRQLNNAEAGVLRWHLLVPTLFWVVVLVVSTQTRRFASDDTPLDVMVALGSGFRNSALVFLAGAAIAWWCLRRRRITAAVLSVALGHFAADDHSASGVRRLWAAQERRADRQGRAASDRQRHRPCSPFAPTTRRCRSICAETSCWLNSWTSSSSASGTSPGKSIVTLDEFIARWRLLPQGAAYMRRDTWAELGARGVPMRVVFEDPRRMVVMKP